MDEGDSDIDDLEESFCGIPKSTAPARLSAPMRPEYTRAANYANLQLLGPKGRKETAICNFVTVYRPGLISRKKIESDLVSKYPEMWSAILVDKKTNSKMQWKERIESATRAVSRQEETYFQAHTNPIEMSCLKSMKFFESRALWQDITMYLLDLREGRAAYQPSWALRIQNGWVWKTETFSVAVMTNGAGWIEWDDHFSYLATDVSKLMMEVCASRATTMIACEIAECRNNKMYPMPDTLEKFLSYGDNVLRLSGNTGYNVLKKMESLVVAAVLKEERPSSDHAKDFWNLMSKCDTGCPGEKEFYDAIDSIVTTRKNWDQAFQIFGLFRIFGYPFISMRQGLTDQFRTTHVVRAPPRVLAANIDRRFKQIFFTNYLRKNGKLPKWAAVRECHLTEKLREGNVPDDMSAMDISEWDNIVFTKTFDSKEFLDREELMMDKSCSAGKAETREYIKQGEIPPSVARKTIIRFLESNSDHLTECLEQINDHGFDEDDLVIGLVGKERELKASPRVFSLLTERVRDYVTATEHLIAECIVPCMPDLLMGKPGLETRRLLTEAATVLTREETNRKYVMINTDFEKWNGNQRQALLGRLFKTMDNLFGFDNVISRTHELFNACTYYCADGILIPSLDEFDNNRGPGLAWKGNLGGQEGLRQKGWTIATALLIREICIDMNIVGRMLSQGDNQIILLEVVVSNATTDTEVERTCDRLVVSFLDRMEKVFEEAGLPLKVSECWTSQSLFAYGKHTYFGGRQLNMALKKLNRMFFYSNDQFSTLDGTITEVFSKAGSATEQDLDAFIGLLVACIEAEQAFALYEIWNPLGGEGLKKTLAASGIGREKRSSAIRSLPHFDWLQALLLSSGSLSGYYVQNYAGLCLRGVADPLTHDFGFCREYLRRFEREGSPLHRAMSCHYSPDMRTGEKKQAIIDPFSIPIKRVPRKDGAIKDLSDLYLKSSAVVRDSVNELAGIETEFHAEFVEALSNSIPFLPRLGHLFLENTQIGLARKRMNKYRTTTSVIKKAKKVFRQEGIHLDRKLQRIDGEKYLAWGASLENEHWKKDVFKMRSMEYADEIRTAAFGEKPHGVSNPYILSYTVPVPLTGDVCTFCEKGSPFISCLSSKDLCNKLARGETGIKGKMFFGSKTVEKQSNFSEYEIITRSTVKTSIERLRSLRGWLVKPGTVADEVLTHLLESLTDIPVEELSGKLHDLSSSSLHRLNDNLTGKEGYPGFLTSITQCSNVSTNTLGLYAKGKQDFPINFQQLIARGYHVAFFFAVKFGFERVHLHLVDPDELPVLTDNQVDFPPDTPILRMSLSTLRTPSLFLRKEEVATRKAPLIVISSPVLLDVVSLSPSKASLLAHRALGWSLAQAMSDVSAKRQPRTQLTYLECIRCDPMLLMNNVAVALVAINASSLSEMPPDEGSMTPSNWCVSYTRLWIANQSAATFTVLTDLIVINESRLRIARSHARPLPLSSFPISLSDVTSCVRSLLSRALESGLPTIMRGPVFSCSDHLSIPSFISAVLAIYLSMDLPACPLAECKRGLTLVSSSAGRTYNTKLVKSVFVHAGEEIIRDARFDRVLQEGKTMRAIKEALRCPTLNIPHEDLRAFLMSGDPPVESPYVRRSSVDVSSRHAVLCTDRPSGDVTLPLTYLFKPLKMTSSAIYKFISLMSGQKIRKNSSAFVAADGTGGFALGIALLWPDIRIYFNSLVSAGSSNAGPHTETSVIAMDFIVGKREKGSLVNLTTPDMPTDISELSFATSVVTKFSEGLSIITCDANYDPQDGAGLRIIKNLCKIAKEKGNPDMILMAKLYTGHTSFLNCKSHLLANFSKCEFLESPLSNYGTTEIYAVCFRPINGGAASSDRLMYKEHIPVSLHNALGELAGGKITQFLAESLGHNILRDVRRQEELNLYSRCVSDDPKVQMTSLSIFISQQLNTGYDQVGWTSLLAVSLDRLKFLCLVSHYLSLFAQNNLNQANIPVEKDCPLKFEINRKRGTVTRYLGGPLPKIVIHLSWGEVMSSIHRSALSSVSRLVGEYRSKCRQAGAAR